MSEEFLGFGALCSPKDIRDYKIRIKDKEFPSKFCVVNKTYIKNQGNKPTCVAHALSEIIEYNYRKENKEYERFSTDFIYGLRDSLTYKPEQEGMYLREGLSIIKDFGDVFYEDLSSNNYFIEAKSKVQSKEDELKQKAFPYRITSYYKINSLNELRYSLINHGPVAGSMRWYKKSSLKKYIYSYNSSNAYSGHAVIIVGWINNYFIVQNSWGKSWGKNGLFLIHEDDIFKLFFELYGITDDIQSVKKPIKPVKTLAPMINFILNKLFTKGK